MRKFLASLLVVFAMFVGVATIPASAQIVVGPRIGIGVEVGVPPVCEYGYYDYEPYACAPYGFYGPGYFYNGIFLGVGPWWGWGYGHGWGGHRFEGGHGGRYRGDGHGGRYHGDGRGGRGGSRGYGGSHGGGRGGRGGSRGYGGSHGGGSRGGHGGHGGHR